MIRFLLALLNLLGFPGIGTYLAGHKRTGLMQMALGASGFLFTLLPMAYLLAGPLAPILKQMAEHLTPDNYAQLSEQLTQKIENGEINPMQYYLPVLLSLFGVFIFLCNWLWSSTTTKPKRKNPPPLPR